MRVDQLRGAQTMQDIDLAVRDLRAPGTGRAAHHRAGAAEPTGHGPAARRRPAVAAGQLRPGRPRRRRRHRRRHRGRARAARRSAAIIAAIILVAVVVPIAGAVIAFFAARDSFPEFGGVGPTDDTTYLPGQAPGENGVNVHTVDGYNDMVDALRDETDATYAFSAVLYPRYAVLEIPTGTNNRYEDFYWDGESLELQDIKGTTDDAAGRPQPGRPAADDRHAQHRPRPDRQPRATGTSSSATTFGSGRPDQRLRQQRLRRVDLHHRDPRRHGRLRLRGPVALADG